MGRREGEEWAVGEREGGRERPCAAKRESSVCSRGLSANKLKFQSALVFTLPRARTQRLNQRHHTPAARPSRLATSSFPDSSATIRAVVPSCSPTP
eukprot:1002923-Rhodomonas_salina.2